MIISDKWKEWVAYIDEKTCLICRENCGRIYDINDFSTQPRPPVHPNCRCEIKKMKAFLAGSATRMGRDGADWWLKNMGKLPKYYISKSDAKRLGWIKSKGNLSLVAPGKMVGGEEYYNDDGKLPAKNGRVWYEADINYISGYRDYDRILFSNDGLIFVTYDHYHTFIEIQ